MILYTNFLEFSIIGPGWMKSLLGCLLAEFIPFLYFSDHLLLAILPIKLLVVDHGHAFNHDRLAVGKSIAGYLFSLVEIEGKVDA
jgi:hypothetical protein